VRVDIANLGKKESLRRGCALLCHKGPHPPSQGLHVKSIALILPTLQHGEIAMPGWTEALKLLGFSTPLIYASAAYGFFHWLDRKASAQAKRAISRWLVPREYDKAAIQAAILELFDNVYTKPLLARRAFLRSALITICVVLVVLYELDRSAVLSQCEF